mmetsp:Transcript_50517/g.130151  ORF Transcript_50517/g.130151 Transcript_50517/m.130151 type:complete len:205 (-) Transcript_50517:377-991(-)
MPNGRPAVYISAGKGHALHCAVSCLAASLIKPCGQTRRPAFRVNCHEAVTDSCTNAAVPLSVANGHALRAQHGRHARFNLTEKAKNWDDRTRHSWAAELSTVSKESGLFMLGWLHAARAQRGRYHASHRGCTAWRYLPRSGPWSHTASRLRPSQAGAPTSPGRPACTPCGEEASTSGSRTWFSCCSRPPDQSHSPQGSSSPCAS